MTKEKERLTRQDVLITDKESLKKEIIKRRKGIIIQFLPCSIAFWVFLANLNRFKPNILGSYRAEFVAVLILSLISTVAFLAICTSLLMKLNTSTVSNVAQVN